MTSRRLMPVLAACAALLAWGCGAGTGRPALEVSAAASLRHAFKAYAGRFAPAGVNYSFAGSDTLAAQIERGVRPDVFASANEQLPAALYMKGLVERPVDFAANELVIAVPVRSSITGLKGLERPGVTLALGAAGVPVGAYSEKVIARLSPSARRALLANVRDREPDVTGIVGKLAEGAVDAGLLYATDVTAAAGRLRAIPLPAPLRPRVRYAAAVVRGSAHPVQARAFIAGLLAGEGRRELLRAGFLPR